MFTSNQYFSPPPSPPSSPIVSVDSSPESSPPSSPSIEPILLNSPRHVPVQHPFAGSMKADRRPPLYEKKVVTPSKSLEPVAGPSNSERDLAQRCDGYPHHDTIFPPAFYSSKKTDMEVWNDAITEAMAMDRKEHPSQKHGHNAKKIIIDLRQNNLTFIPSSIDDLAKIVTLDSQISEPVISPLPGTGLSKGRVFARSATAPAGATTSARAFLPSKTTSTEMFSLPPMAGHEIQLYLSLNAISTLPKELFSLRQLTVLILRSNNIEFLPPEIAHLENLQELNVANNRLRYLPAEMLGMNIQSLCVHPNPFIPPPTPPDMLPSVAATSSKDGPHSMSTNTHLLPPMTPLTEICLRVLHTPSHIASSVATTSASEEPTITVFYGRPLPAAVSSTLPGPLLDTLDVCSPGSVPQPISKGLTAPMNPVPGRLRHAVTGLGVCPSPRHLQSSDGQYKKPVFIRHTEEKFTWEGIVAGVSLGGEAPLLWRGCSDGCLDFLNEEENNGTAFGGENVAKLNVVRFDGLSE